jgi:hypothetical protein
MVPIQATELLPAGQQNSKAQLNSGLLLFLKNMLVHHSKHILLVSR